METKYGFEFSTEEIKKEIIRLTNQLWKLIPMRENKENWEQQLQTVIIDIAGKDEIFLHNSQYLQLLSKLEGLQVISVDFSMYRKTIFECINLLNERE
jgi:hypothetical protein